MTIEEIKELIQVVNETAIAELEVQRGENRVRIRRSTTPASPHEVVMPTVLPVSLGAPQSPQHVLSAAPSVPAAASLHPVQSVPSGENEEEVIVKSPIVGTYYDSPSPGSPPFVRIGDQVEPKQVLCIIESMKLMNEIEAEIAGTISRKLVENGRPVEYGESLFSIRPR